MNENLMDQSQEEPELDPNKNYYQELVGPDRRFKDNETLARAKAHSDSYIKILEKRMDEMRADYLEQREQNMAKAKLQDLIDQYKQQTSSNEPTHSERSQEKPEFDMDKLDSLISEKLRLAEDNKKQTENFNQVKSKLKEKFGNRYPDVLQTQLETLGLSVDEANAWARKSPTAFFKMLGIDEPPKNQPNYIPNTNVRSDTFKPQGEQVRRMSYYKELKKSNPKLYYDREINIQMQKDAIAQGESFFDVD